MFEKYDLTKTMDDSAFEKAIPQLRERLGILQRTLRDLQIPVIIVIEGWNAAGITMSTKEIIQSLDPRGFTLHATENATDEERAHPFMWRFWIKTPSKGRIALFARSWYSRALAEKLVSIGWKKSLKEEINSIAIFERQLNDSGAIIIKFFLHISKDEQKVRLLERERNPFTAWMVTPSIWDFHHNYDTYLPLIDEFIEKTDSDYAPWHIIEATDRKYAIFKVYSHLVKTLDKCIADREEQSRKGKQKSNTKPPKNPVQRRSSAIKSYSKEECQDLLGSLQIEMLELNYILFKRKIPFVIVYEGWDAAGKGGNITRLARYINPLGTMFYRYRPRMITRADTIISGDSSVVTRKPAILPFMTAAGTGGCWLNVWKGTVLKTSGSGHTRKSMKWNRTMSRAVAGGLSSSGSR